MGEYFQRPPLMVFSVPQDVGTLLESNPLEEIIFAFEYHVEAWKREFQSSIQQILMRKSLIQLWSLWY